MWTDDTTQKIKPNRKGSGRMVSDFVDEYGGFLALSDEEHEAAVAAGKQVPKKARKIIEYRENGDGYWTNDKFMAQMKDAIDIADIKYPEDKYDVIWLFDQSRRHTKMSKDALNASKLNKSQVGNNLKCMIPFTIERFKNLYLKMECL